MPNDKFQTHIILDTHVSIKLNCIKCFIRIQMTTIKDLKIRTEMKNKQRPYLLPVQNQLEVFAMQKLNGQFNTRKSSSSIIMRIVSREIPISKYIFNSHNLKYNSNNNSTVNLIPLPEDSSCNVTRAVQLGVEFREFPSI